jgi:hypothetical protein
MFLKNFTFTKIVNSYMFQIVFLATSFEKISAASADSERLRIPLFLVGRIPSVIIVFAFDNFNFDFRLKHIGRKRPNE